MTFQLSTTPSTHSLAASSATKAEEELAKKLAESDSKAKPVVTDKRPWRPQVTSEYQEPECFPDPLSDMHIIFQDYGKSLWCTKSPLPPRDDIIKFIPTQHEEEIKRNLQWRECPDRLRPEVESIIKTYWDVFAEEGVRKNIRGVQFNVDTGQIKPVCCKPPRYGPHESRVIEDLVSKLERNGLVEDDDGPWGALIVLAAKPNQDHVH